MTDRSFEDGLATACAENAPPTVEELLVHLERLTEAAPGVTLEQALVLIGQRWPKLRRPVRQRTRR